SIGFVRQIRLHRKAVEANLPPELLATHLGGEGTQISTEVTTQVSHFSNAKHAIPSPAGGRNRVFRGKY
ncbi:MAG: hypothetical protein NTZ50_05955, partial [Chloroflexi bacterium]|nr:hypothetical protein [Chloroflexota bacterium]